MDCHISKTKSFKKALSVLWLLLLQNYYPASCNESIQNKKIVIIGAGPSGIAAATKLLKFGFKDLVTLEAEPRIGGRINTIEFGENVVDLGAQWCHGEKNNVVYEMVKELNLFESSEEIYINATLNRSNGEVVPRAMQQRLEAIAAGLRGLREAEQNMTAYDFIKTEMGKALKSPENEDIDKIIANEFFDCFEKGETSQEGADSLTEISMWGQKDYQTCEGDVLLNWKDKGYRQFLSILLQTAERSEEFGLLQPYVKLMKQVNRINWQRDDLKVLVECEHGEQILADHVIVTVSLGVLKAQHAELFTPDLPKEKQQAIEFINFGAISKIFVEFKEKFWPENWTGLSILWREQDLKEIRGTERFWLEGIYGFYGYQYQPNVLEGWAIGPFGRHMESLPDDVVKNECLVLFKKFLPWAATEVVNFTKTAWSVNPNFRGTYSYHSIKTNEAGARTQDLESPLTIMEHSCEAGSLNNCQRPVVLFAGEATHPHYYSTVHGAVETGWREAKRLADFYGVDGN